VDEDFIPAERALVTRTGNIATLLRDCRELHSSASPASCSARKFGTARAIRWSELSLGPVGHRSVLSSRVEYCVLRYRIQLLKSLSPGMRGISATLRRMTLVLEEAVWQRGLIARREHQGELCVTPAAIRPGCSFLSSPSTSTAAAWSGKTAALLSKRAFSMPSCNNSLAGGAIARVAKSLAI
jgi:hypothetical protein